MYLPIWPTPGEFGIIMVSSELPEIIGLCDRVYVMRDGRVSGEFSGTDLSEEKLMQAATV